jgi:hypothetical protein
LVHVLTEEVVVAGTSVAGTPVAPETGSMPLGQEHPAPMVFEGCTARSHKVVSKVAVRFHEHHQTFAFQGLRVMKMSRTDS